MLRPVHQSTGPLPARFDGLFNGNLLIFSDASLKRNGGLAAVLFSDAHSDPQVMTRTVVPAGSNELELQAALFALSCARQNFPGQSIVLFSDNLDTINRLNQAQHSGLEKDAELAEMFRQGGLAAPLAGSVFHWIKGHSACRGNTLADMHASRAACLSALS